MSYRLDIHPKAMADISEAAGWYEQRQPGLGERFAREVISAIDSLGRDPLLYRLRHHRLGVRWCSPVHFPYRIVYRVVDEVITIVAIIHAARQGWHWKERL